MGFIIILLILIGVLAVIVFRRSPIDIATLSKPAKWLFYIALVLVALYVGFWLMFGVGEMASGDMSGASHLVPATALVLLIWFARRRPSETGIGLAAMGLLACGFFLFSGHGNWTANLMAVFYGGLPFLIPGVLLWLSARHSSITT
jgi:hypothetical protein